METSRPKLKDHLSRCFFRVGLAFSFLTVVARGQASGEVTRPEHTRRSVTVADCIRMTKLGDPNYWMGGSTEDQVAQFSPDGKRFVVVLRKGNLEQNTNEYSLLLWETEGVLHSHSPTVLLTMASSSNREAIKDVTWREDNETLAFLGEQPGEVSQVYAFNVQSHALRKLTNHPTSVTSYSMAHKGDQVAYIAEKPVQSLWDEKVRKEGFSVSIELLSNLVAGQRNDAHGYYGERELFLQSESTPSNKLNTKGRIDLLRSIPSLSPDGKYILIPSQTSEIPEQWKEYSDPSIREFTAQQPSTGLYSFLRRYVLIDTKTGESRVLLDSPVRQPGVNVAWSPDSHSVAISNVYLPLQNTYGEERTLRESTEYAVEVKVPGGAVNKIAQEKLRLLKWESKTNCLVFESLGAFPQPTAGTRIVFRKRGDLWEKITGEIERDYLPKVVLEEDMISPPRIFAMNLVTHERNMLLDLNPQFEELKFARVEEIEWKGSDGSDEKGGLYYPVDYVPGKRYALVIQTHGWNPNKFWIDGPWTSAFAAQALAAKGFAVLQVPDPREEVEGTPEEAASAVAAFEGAVKYLDGKGLIDPQRVGLIGFSRTGVYVRFALTHSTRQFAAASVMDSTDGGYFQYLVSSNAVPSLAKYMEGINGAAPFGEGLKKWMQFSPGLNADKVTTPFRIVSPRAGASVLFEWEWFAALTLLRKPVEMVMLEDGEHILQKPWDRMVSQQGNVDWFAFWLKGEEDPDPLKKDQYERWHELQRLQRGRPD